MSQSTAVERKETRADTRSVSQRIAAHAAGLSAGDALVALDGLRITDPASLDRLLAAYAPGDSVELHVFRRDELRQFRVTLGAPPATLCVLEYTPRKQA